MLEFIFPQQAVVYKNAIQTVPNCFVDKRGGHRRIHASGKTHYHFVGLFYLVADLLNRHVNKVSRRPVLAASADIDQKISQHIQSLGRMPYFRMKLYSPDFLQYLRM